MHASACHAQQLLDAMRLLHADYLCPCRNSSSSVTETSNSVNPVSSLQTCFTLPSVEWLLRLTQSTGCKCCLTIAGWLAQTRASS